MDPKQRERLIVMVLPAAVLLLGYSFFFSRPQNRAVREKQTELQAAQRSAVSEQEVLIARARLAEAQKTKAETTAEIEQYEAAMQELVAPFGRNPARFAVMERIDRLLREHEIVLVSQSLVEQQSLSTRQKELLQKVEQRAGGGRLEYRRFHLEGGYAEVQGFLSRLAESEAAMLPVSLEAKKPEGEGPPAWELVMVM
jgi:hypothetical protein